MPRTAEPPFGLSRVVPAFERKTRVAKALFDAFDASIVLVDGDRAWRSRESRGLPARDRAAEFVKESGAPLWIEDGRADPRFCDDVAVTGPMGLRFYAAAPVRLDDGSIPGVLCVVGQEPRPFDAKLARCLADLADGVAEECNRARIAEAAARSQAELERTQRILAAFVGTAPVSLAMTDREMRLLKASPRWLDKMGKLREEDVRGQTLYDIRPDVYPKFRSYLEQCLRGETIRSERMPSEHEGRKAWLTAELTPWRDEHGEVGGVILTAHDITDLVRALAAAERSEQRLQLAMETADIHVWEMDYRRRVLEKAGAEDSFFEQPKTFEDLCHDLNATIDPRDRDIAIQAWRKHLADGTPYRAEYRVVRNDGQEVWASTSCREITDEAGRTIRVIGAMRNITQSKRVELELLQAKEDAEAANRAKSTFLATMSHEIRTPLNGVLGMAQAMAGDALAPEQRERLDVIRESGETLLAILNDVLDLSKIEAGKLELDETDFDMAELARGAHAAFTALANKKGLSFALAIDPKAHGVYRGDSTRVRQILYNLVSNALKFTEAGEVRVSVGPCERGIRLSISDTGIGISDAGLASLFQKFEQADASTTRRFGGTGLGLSICRELATLMGGEIRAESTPGRGSDFVVTLPLPKVRQARKAPARAAKATAPAADAQAELSGPPIRVLAAEDNAINQLVLKTLLHQIGVDPVLVDNGRDVLSAWESGVFDVILMDVQMPEMDGPTAAQAIRERESATGRRRTPIIALTANAMSHQVAEYMACGMDGFVAKPIAIERLFAALQQALAGPDQGSEAGLTRIEGCGLR